MNVDRFLAWFYRAQERRSSPRSASLEARHHSSPEHAQAAEEKYAAALRLLGALESSGALTPEHVRVLRAYYLGLANHHCAYVVDRFFGERSITRRMVEPGTVAVEDPELEVADIVSYANWRALAAQTGVGSDGRARRLWSAARSMVSDVLGCAGADDY